MDVLADVLQVLRLNTNTYFCSEFMGSWGMEIPKGNAGLFHAVIDGECWLTVSDTEQVIKLNAGDIITFPTGAAHKVSDPKGSRWLPGEDVVAQVQAGNNPFNEGDNSVTLLCGSFEYDTSIEHPFLKDLPCFIYIQNNNDKEKWLHSFIEVLASESRYPKPGSTVLIDCLTEALFVQIIRAYMRQQDNSMRYLSALMHSQIGAALNTIHNDKTADCTVESLANKVAMSRTTFTDKFTEIVGMPPKRYMINWRMQKARRQLQTTQDAMITIAETAGYHSEAAFNKAYKQFFGETPGTARAN